MAKLAGLLGLTGEDDSIWTFDYGKKHEREFEKTFSNTFLSWQEVETSLFIAYVMFFPKGNVHLLSATFHAVISLDARLAMVDAVAQMQLSSNANKALLESWGVLGKKIRKIAKKRNRLAHFSIHEHDGKNGLELRLRPNPIDFRGSRKEYGVADIEQFRSQFSGLVKEISQFALDVKAASLRYT